MRYGHFDTDADEYVIERPDVPMSWTNYLGTRDYGQSGSPAELYDAYGISAAHVADAAREAVKR